MNRQLATATQATPYKGRRSDEWGRFSDAEHELVAREHARVPGKTQRIHSAREKEGAALIRELRAR